MPKMVCRSCTYSEQMTEREAEFGGMCPRCHSYLSPVIKRRPGKTAAGLSPSTVRNLIATPICFLIGMACVISGYNRMGDRGAVLWARVFAFGILMIIAGVLSLVAALAGTRKDLSDE